jgi:hypothetical protein
MVLKHQGRFTISGHCVFGMPALAPRNEAL